jgi:hypothetical protein
MTKRSHEGCEWLIAWGHNPRVWPSATVGFVVGMLFAIVTHIIFAHH